MPNKIPAVQYDILRLPDDVPSKSDGVVSNYSVGMQNDAMGMQNDIVGMHRDMENDRIAGISDALVRNISTDMQNDITCMQSPDILMPSSPFKDEGTHQLDLTRDAVHENDVHPYPSERALAISPCRLRRNGPRKLFAILRAILHFFPVSPLACKGLAMLPGCSNYSSSAGARALTGTLFGQRKGHVHFAVQDDPNAQPLLLLELATPTNTLVKEMASGLVRIALECERTQNRGRLLLEQVWTMYCNGRKTGYAIRRACSEADLQVFELVKAVSMGAGVLPMREEGPDGELMYMRARFERVVGSRDSEAFYMMNPDGSSGPELSIFLLRI